MMQPRAIILEPMEGKPLRSVGIPEPWRSYRTPCAHPSSPLLYTTSGVC